VAPRGCDGARLRCPDGAPRGAQVASHLLASIPHGTFVECFHPDRDPIWWKLVANRPPLVDGMLELGDAPGLDWELDPDFIEAHRVT
jgi:L-alanine-DL-glutamate epimerase-like enolase superfamily enzyme